MSIKLITMPLCENCGQFEPDVNRVEITGLADEFPQYHTEIRCEHEEKCRYIVKRGLALAQEDAL